VTLSLSSCRKGLRPRSNKLAVNEKYSSLQPLFCRHGIHFCDRYGHFRQHHSTFTFTLAVSAAVGTAGTGTQVNLSSQFNVNGIYTDGTTYSDRGAWMHRLFVLSESADDGREFSPAPLFDFGPANELDAVGCSGQSVALPEGQFSGLMC